MSEDFLTMFHPISPFVHASISIRPEKKESVSQAPGQAPDPHRTLANRSRARIASVFSFQNAAIPFSLPPVSTVLAVSQVLVYLLSDRIGIRSEEDVQLSWKKVVQQKEYWRLFVSHFFHFGRFPAFLNAITLYCFGRYLERKINWLPMLIILETIGILSNVFFILINTYVLIYPADTASCGCSNVHFGLRILVAYTMEQRNYEPSVFLGLYPEYLSPIWAPWHPLLEVFLLKLIIHELNVTGQISGILTGFIISFLLKVFPARLIYTEHFFKSRRQKSN